METTKGKAKTLFFVISGRGSQLLFDLQASQKNIFILYILNRYKKTVINRPQG